MFLKRHDSIKTTATLIGLGLGLIFATAACGDDDIELTELAGQFDGPESAHWDASDQVWYVGNFGQNLDLSGATPDQPGYISKLDADGEMLDARFAEVATGDVLGMAVLDGTLYASHGSDLLAIDTSTGAVDTIAVPDAAFLNDVATGNGAVFISDTGANTIYRYVPGGQLTVFSQDPALSAPNGLYVDGDAVMVANLGAFPPDASTPGGVFALDGNGAATRLGDFAGVLDGLEKIGDDYIISDFNGQIYRVDSADGTSELIIDVTLEPHNLSSSADIGLDPESGTVLVPDLAGNKAFLFDLP